MATVEVGRIAAKGGHFHLPSPGRPLHEDHAKGGAYRSGAPASEHVADLRRRGIGRHIVVLRNAAE